MAGNEKGTVSAQAGQQRRFTQAGRASRWLQRQSCPKKCLGYYGIPCKCLGDPVPIYHLGLLSPLQGSPLPPPHPRLV